MNNKILCPRKNGLFHKVLLIIFLFVKISNNRFVV